MGALGLVVNAIALWNTDYMGQILAGLTRQGEPRDPADVARLSPMLHAHIDLLGHYRFELPPPVAAGERRALRLAGSSAPRAASR